MLAGKIVLENGEETSFYLDDDMVRKAEYDVKKQNEYESRSNSSLGPYTMADLMRFGIKEYIESLPDPNKGETDE